MKLNTNVVTGIRVDHLGIVKQIAPDFDPATRIEAKCDQCGIGIYLGPRTLAVVATGVPKLCVLCIRELYGVEAATKIIGLSG